MMSMMKKTSQMIGGHVINIPTPTSISYMWNMGSLLGVCLCIQIVSGFFLSMHYESSMNHSFDSVVSICNNVNSGWIMRSMHANGASAFFICIYIHVGRGIYYKSFSLKTVWIVGVMIIFLLMGTAFMGYVLPWGQMSFWGATVITNLVSAIPYVGTTVVQWLWGGFSVSKPTLIRFFSIHFILPFVLAILVLVHLAALHSTGSSNPLGVSPDSLKVNFHPYFTIKDIVGLLFFLFMYMTTVLIYPDLFMDPDNFLLANPMNTPPHIQPEWYFLFAYAVLRSIPNKLGGVIALVMSILVLAILPFINKGSIKPRFNPINKIMFWSQVVIFFLLTWIGSMPVEVPFTLVGQVLSLLYFVVLLLIPML